MAAKGNFRPENKLKTTHNRINRTSPIQVHTKATPAHLNPVVENGLCLLVMGWVVSRLPDFADLFFSFVSWLGWAFGC